MKLSGSTIYTAICGLLTAFHIAAMGAEGMVLNERVNVRTRPSITSEVIHQLNTGDRVTIVDRINLNDPQPNEPREWFRILIPSQVELWISSEFIDSAQNTVTASRLNVRSGPGKNYSVVGRIDRNTVVEPIRINAGWTAIKPLPSTVAYVAQEFVKESSTATAAEIIEEPQESIPPVAPTVSSTPTSPPPRTERMTLPDIIIDDTGETDQPVAITSPPPIESASRFESTPAPVLSPPTTSSAPSSSPIDGDSLFDRVATGTRTPTPSSNFSEPPPIQPLFTETENPIAPQPAAGFQEELARVITRDGIVRRARNIQAPTYHRLDDPRTGNTINYLYTGKLQLDLGTGPAALKPYEGRKIRVMGIEAVDARWPRVPVIEVEQLRVLE